MTTKKVRLQDIANKLNISQNTVSLAMRGMPGIKESTRELVQKTARELGYCRNGNADPTTIFLVTTLDNSTDSYFYTFLLQQLEEELNFCGFKLITSHCSKGAHMDSVQIINILNQMKPKGIFILGEIEENICHELLKTGLPTVCVGFYCPNLQLDSVVEDNISGIRTMMKYLHKKGYRSFGFVGNTAADSSFWERWVTYAGVLVEYGLEYNREANFISQPKDKLCDSDFLTEKLKSISSLPEVFICGNDKIAAAIIKALNTLGYQVPQEIGVVGFDNSEIAKNTIPSLTTVDSFRNQQAKMAVNLMMMKINKSNVATHRVVIPVELIEGKSTTPS